MNITYTCGLYFHTVKYGMFTKKNSFVFILEGNYFFRFKMQACNKQLHHAPPPPFSPLSTPDAHLYYNHVHILCFISTIPQAGTSYLPNHLSKIHVTQFLVFCQIFCRLYSFDHGVVWLFLSFTFYPLVLILPFLQYGTLWSFGFFSSKCMLSFIAFNH